MLTSEIQQNRKDVCVVVPAYNEARVIRNVIDDLTNYIPREKIILVDDGSTDETSQIGIQQNILVIKHAFNRGQGAALATGIKAALDLNAQVIVTFDADGQHKGEDILSMIEPILTKEADVVLGSRFLRRNENMPFLRKAILKAGVIATQLLSRISVTDTHNGFRAFSRSAAHLLKISQDNMAHASEIIEQIAQHKFSYVERAVCIDYSTYSRAKGQKNSAALKLAFQIIFYKVFHS